MKGTEQRVFRAELLAWFRRFQRDLPWRRSKDAYRIWISEIMLQQTRVAAVIPYYERFLQRFPDVSALAEAPEEQVLRLWSGLGYYSRARNLQAAARQIVAKHGGVFPRFKGEALELAGIGEYTAAAILSIAYGERLAVVDGNVARVLARLDAVRGDLREGKTWKQLQARADELLDPEAPGDWNQAVMELGATLCTPQNPQCLLCPVRSGCKAAKLGIASEIPEKRKKRATVRVQLATAVLMDGQGRVLLLPPPKVAGKSTADAHVPSLVAKLWHFPTSPTGADMEKAVRSMLGEFSGLARTKQARPEPLAKVKHTVTYRRIEVTPYLVRLQALPEFAGSRQCSLGTVLELPVSNLTRKVARGAIEYLGGERFSH